MATACTTFGTRYDCLSTSLLASGNWLTTARKSIAELPANSYSVWSQSPARIVRKVFVAHASNNRNCKSEQSCTSSQNTAAALFGGESNSRNDISNQSVKSVSPLRVFQSHQTRYIS